MSTTLFYLSFASRLIAGARKVSHLIAFERLISRVDIVLLATNFIGECPLHYRHVVDASPLGGSPLKALAEFLFVHQYIQAKIEFDFLHYNASTRKHFGLRLRFTLMR
jgi:hypothetical protein